MPISSPEKISTVMNFVTRMWPRPRRILDVGIGWGTYGLLCREHLDLVRRDPSKYKRDDWQTEIVGVEVFEGYRNPVWDYAYDEVHVGDATTVVPRLGSFDLVLLCDVLEHLPKDVGRSFLENVLSQSSCVIVSSPRGYSEQDAAPYGNEWQRHVSGWSKRDLRRCHRVYRRCGRGFVAFLSRGRLPNGVTRFSLLKRRVAAHLPPWVVRAYSRLERWLRGDKESAKGGGG
ncbi:MAG TPA: class I SAM-dependent methyltransferase [Planctomycetota bacterium]|nr:class I SAM-dependent methyltransferase [Planctomycetota bacterium]